MEQNKRRKKKIENRKTKEPSKNFKTIGGVQLLKYTGHRS